MRCRKQESVVKQCVICGVDYDCPLSLVDKRSTCSTKCNDKVDYHKPNAKCEVCGGGYYRSPSAISHFTCGEECRIKRNPRRIPLEDILAGKHPKRIGQPALIHRLFDAGIKERRCEWCGLEEWCGVLITLELHHADGNNRNHRRENLFVLCPNCHSLTPNYKSKGRDYKKKRSHQLKA